jgi:hypothetical protein
MCLSSQNEDDLIVPCLCTGTQRVVHRKCLDQWRVQESGQKTFTHCPTCNFQYHVDVAIESTSERGWAYLSCIKHQFLIARDVGLFVFLSFLLLCVVVKFILFVHAHVSECLVNLVPIMPEMHATEISVVALPFHIVNTIFTTGLGIVGLSLLIGTITGCAALVVTGIIAIIVYGCHLVQRALKTRMGRIARQDVRRIVVRDLSNLQPRASHGIEPRRP